jgi:universal stress protein E
MADKTILVVVNPTETGDQPVIERAAWLAEKASAAIELFACDFDPQIDAGQVSTVWVKQAESARDHLCKIHGENLAKLAEPLKKRGLSVKTDVAWDHPLGEAILRKVAESKPWLVAKDTHHHSVLKRTVFSNTDWHLIRGCSAPLLLVKPRAIAKAPKFVAAIDPLHEHDKPAQLDDKILTFAAALAKSAGGQLDVVHAYAPPIAVDLPMDVIEQIGEQHRLAMGEFVAKHKVADERAHLLEGPPVECLVDFTTEESSDFIVMGAVSRRGIDRLFIGSTANAVLDRLPCDLVIVKPEGFEASLPQLG